MGSLMVAINPRCVTCKDLEPAEYIKCGETTAAAGCKVLEAKINNEAIMAKLNSAHPHYNAHCTILSHRLAGRANIAVPIPEEKARLYAIPFTRFDALRAAGNQANSKGKSDLSFSPHLFRGAMELLHMT